MGDEDDCNEYICANDKDEKIMKKLFANKSLSQSWSQSSFDSIFFEGPLNAI